MVGAGGVGIPRRRAVQGRPGLPSRLARRTRPAIWLAGHSRPAFSLAGPSSPAMSGLGLSWGSAPCRGLGITAQRDGLLSSWSVRQVSRADQPGSSPLEIWWHDG